MMKRCISMLLCICMLMSMVNTRVFAAEADAAAPETPEQVRYHCGLEPHTHGAECYCADPLCALTEGEGHAHSEGCYEYKYGLICDNPVNHSHSASCYKQVENLVCTQDHTHTGTCYTYEQKITCPYEEGHFHGSHCRGYANFLTCTRKEQGPHTHGDACYLTCERSQHVHTGECEVNILSDRTESGTVTAQGDFTGLEVAPISREKLDFVKSGDAAASVGFDIDLAGLQGEAYLALKIDGVDMPFGTTATVTHLLDTASAISESSRRMDVSANLSAFEKELAAASEYDGAAGTHIYVETIEASLDRKTGIVGFPITSCSSFMVDFRYGEGEFSIPGGSSVLLSEVFVGIGYTAHTAAQAVSVVYSSPEHLTISKIEEDWLLTSNVAFNTEEALTITFGDGEVLVLGVTDPDVLWRSTKLSSSVGLDQLTRNADGDTAYATIYITPGTQLVMTQGGNYSHPRWWVENINPSNISNFSARENSLTGKVMSSTLSNDETDASYKTGERTTYFVMTVPSYETSFLWRSQTIRDLAFFTVHMDYHITVNVQWPDVIFEDYDGRVIDNSQQVQYGNAAKKPANPSRKGYTFTGWQKVEGDYENVMTTKVVARATYSINNYYLDLNGILDGTESGNIANFGTADVYINGSLVASGVSDYYQQHPYGTTYKITNIKSATGVMYKGNPTYEGTLSDTTTVRLPFNTNEYTVRWLNWDGTELEKDTGVRHNSKPTYNGSTPTRTSEEGYSYSFAGWTPSVENATRDINYTATYNATPINYTLTYMDGELLLDSKTYNREASVPTITDPKKDDQVFMGWKVTAAEGNWTLNAQYTESELAALSEKYGNVTLSAQWIDGYVLDLNGLLDKVPSGNIANFGTCDIYVNGVLVANDVTDYNVMHPVNSTYEIKDIKVTREFVKYVGVATGSLTGTLTEKTFVQLEFATDKFTVLWKNWDGTLLEKDENVLAGTTPVFDGNNPTRPSDSQYDYAFTGWSPSISATFVDTTYTAVFDKTAIIYQITYDLQGGSTTGTVGNPNRYTVESKDIVLNNPTRTDHIFLGWSGTDLDGVTLTVTVPTGSTGNRSYVAHWKANNFTVVYRAQKGGSVSLGQETHGKDTGAAAGSTAIPASGYRFVKWVDADGKEVSTQTTLVPTGREDASYTAVFAPIGYQIGYELEGGSFSDDTYPTTYTVEQQVSLPRPVREHYIFAGWTGPGAATASVDVTIPVGSVGDRVYTAHWTPQYQYSIVFEANADGDPTVKDMPVNATTQWILTDTHTFTWEQVPSRTNYYFRGWSAAPDGEGRLITSYQLDGIQAQNKSVTLYARWELSTYTVAFDANEGMDPPEPIMELIGTDVTIPATVPTREGYDFLYWTENRDGSGKTYAVGDSYSNHTDSTLYAQWQRKTYTVTYDTAGGSGSFPQQTKTHFEPLDLHAAAPAKTGYKFLGWLGSDGKTYAAGDPYTAEADLVLTAQWQTLYKYAFRFDPNAQGVAGLPDDVVSSDWEEPASRTVTWNSDPQRAHYTFAGWSTDPNAATGQMIRSYTLQGVAGSTAAVTLYAIWVENQVEIRYLSADTSMGSVSPAAQTVNVLSGAPSATATAKPGYRFTGWYADAACTQLVGADPVLTVAKTNGAYAAATYYAKFEREIGKLQIIPENLAGPVIVTVTDADGHKATFVVSGSSITVAGLATGEATVTVKAFGWSDSITVSDLTPAILAGQTTQVTVSSSRDGDLFSDTASQTNRNSAG